MDSRTAMAVVGACVCVAFCSATQLVAAQAELPLPDRADRTPTNPPPVARGATPFAVAAATAAHQTSCGDLR